MADILCSELNVLSLELTSSVLLHVFDGCLDQKVSLHLHINQQRNHI